MDNLGMHHEPKRAWEIRSAGGVLSILALMNFLNYMDRGILAPITPLLRASPEQGGMGLKLEQIMLLTTAFMVVHSLMSVPLGILGDRWSRKKVIAGGVGLWSLATAAAGLAVNYAQLFLARAAIGIGEASYAPAATAMISERFSPAARARAMGVFQLGMIVGGAAAFVVGGWVGAHYGWRAAFFVVGLPGLLLAGVVLLVREARRRRPGKGEPRPSGSIMLEVAPRASSIVAAVWVTITGIFVTYFVGAFIQIALTFVVDYHYVKGRVVTQEELGRIVAQVTVPFGLLTVVASVLGVLAGSFLADRLERRLPGRGRLLAIAIGVGASVPLAALGLYVPTLPLLYTMLGLGVFFAVWYTGPILAVLHDVVPLHRRATATGAYFLAVHLLGDAISPWISAKIGAATGSLRFGLLTSVGVLALAVPAAFVAMRGAAKLARLKHPASAG